MPSHHLILCRPLLLSPPIFPSIQSSIKGPITAPPWGSSRAGPGGTQLLPVRAGRGLGEQPPSPHPAAGSEATARQLQPGGGSRPEAGRLAAREAGLERGPQRGPSWPAGLLAAPARNIWKASPTLTNRCLKARQSHSEHGRVFFPLTGRTAHPGVSF